MSLTIAMGNGKNKQSLVQWARDADADSFSAHESQRLDDEFSRLRGHRVIVASKDFGEERDRARETCILTKREHEDLGQMTRLVSEKVPAAERVAPDRVLVMSAFAHPVAHTVGFDGIGHFALHPNAGRKALSGVRPESKILREYRESIESTARLMTAFKRDGLLPILTGDLNMPFGVDRLWSPYHVFVRGMNMNYFTDGLDWILWHKDLAGHGRQKRQLHDHVGLKIKLSAIRPSVMR